MSSTHTPGPWRVMPEGRTFTNLPNGERPIRNCAKGPGFVRIVATAHGSSGLVHARTEAEANARLIAEAPAMRDMIETLLDAPVFGLVDLPEYVEARALLARIDGRHSE